jgi:hypothetical protein
LQKLLMCGLFAITLVLSLEAIACDHSGAPRRVPIGRNDRASAVAVR